MSTETIIFIGVGFYIVLMIAIGVYASGKTHTVTEFIVAGRGLPVWLCSTTIAQLDEQRLALCWPWQRWR